MKKTSIGIDDYKKLIEVGCAYVDKTLFIQEVIERGTEIAIIPRPRRFGKTLNMSMLRYFFEKTQEDHSHLFSPYKIWQTKYRELQGKYPVIFFSLKEIKQGTWDLAYEKLQALIAKEFERHAYLLSSPDCLSQTEKKKFQDILSEKANQATTELSLSFLITWLERYHKKRVFVLIDEYDAPIHMAYFRGYYSSLIDFMRNWLGGGLKGNPGLEKGVLTGILRIAKENIFSDLNNGSNFTLFSPNFSSQFGLLEDEVKNLLSEYGMSDKLSEVRKWYNGYHIGPHAIYNPWSILSYIEHKTLKPYWVNTSGNELIKEQLIQKGVFFKEDFETLVLGGAITKLVDEGLVFASLKDSREAVWGLLLFSGYLTLVEMPDLSRTRISCKLTIPNEEILMLFQDMIRDYFIDVFFAPIPDLLRDLVQGDVNAFSAKFKQLIMNVFSSHDIPKEEPERVYHAFVLGLLASLGQENYEIKSNRESGLGRYDVCLFPKQSDKLGIVLEFKKAKEGEDLSLLADSAIAQIEKLKYMTELKSRGVQKILTLGMAFHGKNVHIHHKIFN